MARIKWLAELREKDVHLAGGKAANLGVLFNNDLPVPNGFVVTTKVFSNFLTETGIKGKINNYLGELDVKDYKRLKQVSKSIKELFLSGDLPTIVLKKIEQAYGKLEEEAVVCRSSSTLEDSVRASFAGQHETFVNVTTFDEIVDSVKNCWASLYTPRVLAYARQKGIEMEGAEMGIIVQRMIEPEKAGVMFTSHPTRDSNEVLIEANWGYGDSVVSGEITPDTYVIDRNSYQVMKSEIVEKDRISGLQGNHISLVEPPDDKRNKECLTELEIRELVEAGLNIEEIFKANQDVEWAFGEGKLKLLQTRPITSL